MTKIDYSEVLNLEPPHGFLMAQEKQTAIARIEPLDTSKSYLIVCNGEAFGVAELDQPAQVKAKEFDDEEWLNQHRITPRERRQWWPKAESFYVYRLKNWYPFEGVKLYEDGKVIDEPKLTVEQWKLISAAKELPKQVTLVNEAISITDKQSFVVDNLVYSLYEAITEQGIGLLNDLLMATYDIDKIVYGNKHDGIKEIIPLYSLALVRNPRMRVSKKNIIAEAIAEKQEDETMPFRIRKRDDEYCVVKVEADDSDGDTMGCHGTEDEAEAQLVALRINVEAEEGESAIRSDKPRNSKPKKEFEGLDVIVQAGKAKTVKKAGFMDNLRSLRKSIGDFLKSAETEEKEVSLFVNNYGIAQKEVNGELWHFAWSTNAFRDREKEIFSTKSLQRYVEQAKESEDKGFFNFWHIAGTDFAEKQWQMVIGRFLVEAGPYLRDHRGEAAKEFFNEFAAGHPNIAPEGWGCSPEYRYLPEERATGIYENIWITRTSTLPKMRAANIWTETSQLARKNMAITDYTKEQIEAAVEVFKDEDFVKSLIQQGETKTAELENVGVAHKSSDEPQEIELNMSDLAAEVGKQFTANLQPIADAIETMETGLKEIVKRLEKVELGKAVEDKAEKPRFIFNLQRASENEGTVVTEDDGLKNQKPAETQAADSDAWAQMFSK